MTSSRSPSPAMEDSVLVTAEDSVSRDDTDGDGDGDVSMDVLISKYNDVMEVTGFMTSALMCLSVSTNHEIM